MDFQDASYEEYVSKRQEELAELNDILGEEIAEEVVEKVAEQLAQELWEAEQFTQYAQHLEELGRTWREDQLAFDRAETEHECKQEQKEEAKNLNTANSLKESKDERNTLS